MFSSKNLSKVFFAFVTLLIVLSFFYVDYKVETIKNKVYIDTAKDLNKRINLMVKEKSESILKITLALSHDTALKDALLKSNADAIKLNELSAKFRLSSNYKHIRFQFIDTQGKSLYRSWTRKKGDSILSVRLDVAQMIKQPKIQSTISTGKFDMTFKSMVPIYHHDIFIGIIETLGKFDSIAQSFLEEGITPLVLVDKKYKKQLQFPFSKRFFGDYYICSLNPDDLFLSYLETKNFDFLTQKKAFFIDEKALRLVTIYYLNDIENKNMGYFFLSKPLEEIRVEEIAYIKQQFILFMVMSMIFSLIFLIFIFKRNKQEHIDELMLEVQRQTTEIKEQKTALYHQAYHDPLTDLPNRLLFQDRLEQAIKNAKRNQTHFALLFIDLDRFKAINDSLGHDVGDRVLIEVAQRIRSTVRDSDTVSRLGGDEFTVILENILIPKEVIHVIQKILDALKDPIPCDKQELYIKASIGISIYPEDGNTVDNLLKNADTAMYKAKQKSQDSFAFYTSE